MAGYSVTFSIVDQATKPIEQITRRIEQMRAPMERQARVMQRFMDASGLNKVAAGFGQIARSAGEAFSSMSRIVPVMGTLTGAASLAGMVSLVQSWANFGNTLQQDATRIGTTTGELRELEDAVTLAGGSADDMVSGLKGITESLYRMRIGDPEAAAWWNKTGIELRKANGELKTSTELLPEVIRYLDGIKDPAERMRVAVGLGSDALARIEEQLRRSGRALPAWLAEAKKFAPALDDQGQALTRYNQAVGGLSVAFGHLRDDIGGTLAEALTPLIREFVEWVATHQPQIRAAITEIGERFREFLKGIDWSAVSRGIGEVVDALKWLYQNFNLVLGIALTIKGLQIASGIVGSINAIMGAVGTLGGVSGAGLLAGTGLLGALGMVLWLSTEIYNHWDEIKQAGADLFTSLESGWERVKKGMSDFWRGTATPGEVPAAPGAPAAPGTPGTINVPGYGNVPNRPGPQRPPAVPEKGTGPLAQRAIDYFVSRGWTRQQAAGIAANLATESSWNPQAVGDQGTARGLGQWHPDRQAKFKEVMGKDIKDSTFEDQLAFVDWELNNTEPGAGRRLRGATTASEAGSAVSRYYERPGDVQGEMQRRGAAAQQLYAQLPAAPAAPAPMVAEGKPAQVTGGPPVTGSIDVTVTHKNPPPGATVTAAATGDALKVAPTRTEQQQFDWVS